MTWATSVPILVFVGLSVLDLGLMYATDVRQTDRRQTTDVHHRLMPPRWVHNNTYYKAMVTTQEDSHVRDVTESPEFLPYNFDCYSLWQQAHQNFNHLQSRHAKLSRAIAVTLDQDNRQSTCLVIITMVAGNIVTLLLTCWVLLSQWLTCIQDTSA